MSDARKFKEVLKNDFYTPAAKIKGASEIELNGNDDIFLFNKSELFDAVQILQTQEFTYIIRYHNDYELARERLCEAYTVYEEGCGLYDIERYSERVGYCRGQIDALKDAIVNVYDWDAWVKACQLYEVITRVPREWI